MLAGMHPSTDIAVEAEYVVPEWYMNKSFHSTAVKVLHSVSGDLCRTRFMEDILRSHHMPSQVQPICPGSTFRGGCSTQNATSPECESSENPVSTVLLTEADEDVDIGNMTLKEMCQLLRTPARKSSIKESFAVLSSTLVSEAGSALGNKATEFKTFLPGDSAVQLEGLQLHLDSSTSNSAESSDDTSPRTVATSCHKPIDIVVVKSETLATEDHIQEPKIKKRKSMSDPLTSQNVISIEDDDCTLQMWRLHKRRMCGGKRSGAHGVEQGHSMDEQVSCESSLTPAAVAWEACLVNLAPDIADPDESFYPTSVCPSDGVPLLDIHDSRSETLSGHVVGEGLKGNSSLDPTDDVIAEGLLYNGEQDLKMKTTEMESTTREDDDSEQWHSSLIFRTSLDSLSEVSPQKCVMKASPWALRACKAYKTFATFNSNVCDTARVEQETATSSEEVQNAAPVHPDLCDTDRVEQEHQTSHEEVHDSDWSGTLIGEIPNIEGPSNLACSKANMDPTKVESILPSLHVFHKLPFSDKPAFYSKPVDNEVVSLSQRSTNEVFPGHCTEGSPPDPEKGSDIAQESSRHAQTASQPSDDDNCGSPVGLLPTKRHGTEEELELEQLKPSKIPCKRKAISPLSRERLLQASKFGEHERASHGADKRGLKKLPRAFKGFIRRDTFNHERSDACARARNTANLELSPPEKPLQKEEALPGSPCHNRKKFLPSKCFLPKSSLPPYGDSVVDITVGSSSSLPSPSCVQKLSLVLNSSPSPPLPKILKSNEGKSPTNPSPSMPTKGILRSSPPTCQGACNCEECVSLRHRAERAAEFSQQQMHDIEGLAVRLLKELNTMRCVVEESLIQRTGRRVDSPRSALSSEQVRRATMNALQTEKMAKSWLVRMARDCNRYCKIMRMQERKLTFADELGGQLCHVKLFHSQPKAQPDSVLSNALKDNTATSSIGDNEDCSCPESAFEAASKD